MKYIIEHMDPEMWEWSAIEYKHTAAAVGQGNLMITNVRQEDEDKLDGLETDTVSVSALGLNRVCVLDPAAEKTLEPADASEFDYLVFGGILGNYPAEKRTKGLAVRGAERRNLGKDQFSTDNAVMVAHQIMSGKRLSELEFVDEFVVEMDEGEEIILPFKYLVIGRKPFISEKIIEYVKEHGF
jgi:ribosome biogenesis SPOUT family RNA methylase Rps3